MVIVGVLFAAAELALGAITGFDLALVGASLAAGGVIGLLTQSWHAGLISAAIFALFYFAATILLWDTAVSWATQLFKIDEKEFGRLVLLFSMELRVVIVFFFLVPALALHWMARER